MSETKITLENIDDFSIEEIFDYLVGLVVKQGKKSFRINNLGRKQCQYRAPDGCMCAFGPLIPEDFYGSELEGLSVFAVARRFFQLKKEAASTFSADKHQKLEMLAVLQCGHDHAASDEGEVFVEEFLKAISFIPRRYSFKSVPEIFAQNEIIVD